MKITWSCPEEWQHRSYGLNPFSIQVNENFAQVANSLVKGKPLSQSLLNSGQ